MIAQPKEEQVDWKFVLAVMLYVCGVISGFLIGIAL